MRSLVLAGGLVAFACTMPVGEPVEEAVGAANSATASVCWQQPRQVITGFGASTAWTGGAIPDEQVNELYSPERIGLSLLRMRIAPTGTTTETATALKAQALGATVWAAPWSPPGAWKTNGTDNQGGNLLPEHYGDWAERLAGFVRSQEDQGVELAALSAQNEPDFKEEWETCLWEPSDLTTFVRDHLRPALDAAGVAPKILAPESAGWTSVSNYAESMLRDPVARDAVGIIATHSYNGAPYGYPTPAALGKEFWMTEWSDKTVHSDASGMASGLVVAQAVHENLTIAEVNAWHYWWLVDVDQENPNGNSALIEAGNIVRRAYVIGQWSRFVRPGSTRLWVSHPSPQPGVFVTAFLRETGSDLVVVAVNKNDFSTTQSFGFDGADLGELTPWVTNDDVLLEEQPAVAGGASVSYELSPRSVTTFVGSANLISGATPVEGCSSVLPEKRSTESGCSCRQAGQARNRSALVLALAALSVVSLRRFARRSRAATSFRS